MTEDEWIAVSMLSIIKKRKRLDKFIYQALRDIVKLGGENVIQNLPQDSRFQGSLFWIIL